MDKILQLYGGKQVNPKNLDLDDIQIEAIAHSLSLQCRFAGHCKYHYSTAQHSVYVAQLCPEQYKLCGLLHDATEAYLVDIPSLIKGQSEFSSYKLIEQYVWSVIAYRYQLPVQIPKLIKQIDKVILYWEARTLMRNINGSLNTHWAEYYFYAHEHLEVQIEQWSPERAETEFLALFKGLIINGEIARS